MMTIVLYWDVNYKGIEREKWRVRAFNNYEVKKWFITHMWFKALFLIVTFAKWIKKFNAANFVHWNDEKLLPVAPTTPPPPPPLLLPLFIESPGECLHADRKEQAYRVHETKDGWGATRSQGSRAFTGKQWVLNLSQQLLLDITTDYRIKVKMHNS